MINRLILISVILAFSIIGNRCFAQTQKDTAKSSVFPEYDVMPEFPGGIEKLNEFIRSNTKEVKSASGKRVIISFTIEKDGSLSDIRIARGINEEADKEALRIIKLSPKWKPATQVGQLLRVGYSMPIHFP